VSIATQKIFHCFFSCNNPLKTITLQNHPKSFSLKAKEKAGKTTQKTGKNA
jgi:hypothetical protein